MNWIDTLKSIKKPKKDINRTYAEFGSSMAHLNCLEILYRKKFSKRFLDNKTNSVQQLNK